MVSIHCYRSRYLSECLSFLILLITSSSIVTSSFTYIHQRLVSTKDVCDIHPSVKSINRRRLSQPNMHFPLPSSERLFSAKPENDVPHEKHTTLQYSQQVRFVTNTRCPFAQKAWIALEASSIPYEMVEVALYGEGGKPDWFWKLNPQGTVPVVAVISSDQSSGLDKGGNDVVVFADSELILDAIGDGTIIGDPAKSFLLVDKLNEDEKSRSDHWRRVISKQILPVGKSVILGGESVSKLRTLLKDLNNQVVGPYLIGETMTLADCAAFPFLWRIDQEFGIGGSHGEEKLRLWLDKCMKTEPFRRTTLSQGWWWWW